MRILFIIDNLGSGGAQRQLVNLALLLQEYGYEVKFLTYGKDDFFKYMLDVNHILVDCINDAGVINRILKVRKYIREGDQNVAISFLETPNFLACISAIGMRKWRLIISERSANITSFNSKRGRLFRWFARFADVIVCNSRNAENIWKGHYPMYKEKLLTIYNPILLQVEHWNYYPRKDGILNIIVAASYQYIKNMDGLIEALNLLSDDARAKLHIDWYGSIEVTKGNTEAYDKAIQKIDNYKLNNTIVLNKAIRHINEKMQQADIVALFSKYEGLPNAICEGMMLGKPIIMSKVSDYNSLVDHNNGFLCDAEDPESIKKALESVINLSNQELLMMGKCSKAKAEKLFNKDIIIQKWINIITNV